MTQRLTCQEVFRRLDSYLDRALDETEVRQVEAHLAECAVCAAEYRFELSLVDEVRGKLKRIRASRTLLEGISARLAEVAGESGVHHSRDPRGRTSRVRPVA